MMTAPLAELALTNVRLKRSLKVISTKLIQTNVLIAALALMYVLLKPYTRFNNIFLNKAGISRLFFIP
jgi:hypothetical protein